MLPPFPWSSSNQYPHFTVGKTGAPRRSDLPWGTLSQRRHSSSLGCQHPNAATDEKTLGAASFQQHYVTSSINFMGFCEHNYFWKKFEKEDFTTSVLFRFLLSIVLPIFRQSFLLLSPLLPQLFSLCFISFAHSLHLLQEILQPPMKPVCNTCWNRSFPFYLLMLTYCPMLRILSFAWETTCTHAPSTSLSSLSSSNAGKVNQANKATWLLLPTWEEKVQGWPFPPQVPLMMHLQKPQQKRLLRTQNFGLYNNRCKRWNASERTRARSLCCTSRQLTLPQPPPGTFPT